MSRMSMAAMNQLRVKHLKLIESLVEVGSVHKAAKTLHLSQPTASAMLKEVEAAFGVTLFDRTRKGAVANARGSVAVARMRTILGELAMLSRELQSDRPTPVLRLGCLTYGFFGALQRVLPELLERSDCRIDLREGPSTKLLDLLQSNQLDCLIGRLPSSAVESLMKRGFVYEPLYEAKMCVLAAASHPLARKRKLEFRDLSAYSWILPREGANSRNALMATFAAANLPPPDIRIETSSFSFSLQLSSVSNCLTWAPLEAGVSQQRLGLARILDIQLPNLLTPIAFVASRSAMMNPNVRVMAEVIRHAIEPPSPRERRH